MRRPSGFGLLVGCAVLIAGLTASAGAAADSAEAILRLHLMDQELESRVPFGPPVTYRESIIARTITRQVVTDIESDGTINYVMPMMYLPILPKREIELSELSDMIPAGTRVRVSEITMGRRNVVIGVTDPGRGVPSTIRLRLGRKYEERYSGQQMISLVSRALVLPRYERLEELERQFLSLGSSIDAAELAFAAPGQTNEQRLASGRELESLLRQALDNRQEISALGDDTGDAEQDYQQRLARLEPRLDEAEAVLGKDLIAGIEGQLAELAAQEDSLADELSSAKPGSSSALKKLRGSIAAWEALIERRSELHAELTSLGGELSAAEAERVARSGERLEQASQRLRQADRGVQIGTAVSRLQRLHDEAPQLKADLYSSRLAVAEDPRGFEAKVGRFGKSVDERRRLSRQLDSLGRKVSDPVLQRIEEDQLELERLQLVLEAERGSLEVRELDRAYQELQTEFLEMLDAYTLAFDTAQQLKEAQRLVGHLRKMAGNRESAAGLGSTQAASDLRRIEGQIEDLKRQNPRLR